MRDEFDFSDLQPIEIPVTMPSGKKYVLCECNEAGAAEWRNARIYGTQIEQQRDGDTQKFLRLPTDLGGIQSLLLSHCMFHTDSTGQMTGQRVERGTIQSWKSKITRKLYDKALEISDLKEEAETEEDIQKEIDRLNERLAKMREGDTEAKNSQDDTLDGSNSLLSGE